jgi:fermentation-respiration switch protein FrsA (DUF1100 family)
MKTVRVLAWIVSIYVCGCVAAGLVLAIFSLHVPRRPLRGEDAYRSRVQRQFQASVENVELTAGDGAVLRGWFVQPAHANGEAVVLLHGIADNRMGVAGYGDMFLRNGYSILLPDSREHGVSGGAIATYGIVERDDVRRWVGWLHGRAPGCTFLLGESMGAAIGLQATAVTPQLCAAAVESPYSKFRAIAYDRLAHWTGTAPWMWRTVGRPVIEVALLYARLRNGVNLLDADPEAAVEQSQVPTLLIAGTADTNIPMRHAVELESVCASHCTLWIVPGADHGGATVVAHQEFEQRVVGWFAEHDRR